MHITSSQVALAASHSRQTQTFTQTTVQTWSGRAAQARGLPSAQALATPTAPALQTTRAGALGLATFGPASPFATRATAAGNQRGAGLAMPPLAALAPPARSAQPTRAPTEAVAAPNGGEDTPTDPRLVTIARMIEAITGRAVKAIRPADLVQGSAASPVAGPAQSHPSQATPAAANGSAPGNGAAEANWGMVLTHETASTQTEQVHFQAQGTVQTADGRTLSLQVNLTMASSHTEYSSTQLMLGNATAPAMKDPLVLHFNGPVGDLSGQRFAFDLDADGSTEAMPFVGSGSGFLVLDRNGNGRVDDGRELFGALSGDGFADLAALDEDNNGWIDSGDAVFQRLQVWRMGADGSTTLTALADTGVGAVGLGNVSTEMGLYAQPSLQGLRGQPARDSGAAAHAQLGQLRRSGLYLMESGQAGLVQHIDLAV